MATIKRDYLNEYAKYNSAAEQNKQQADMYQANINNAINKLNSRSFSYDMDNDPLYQQYRDSYQRQGKLAMQDTMGTAAAKTGGYGNSYATSAANQAYNQYMQGLNDKTSDLYQLAYNKYNQETSDLNNEYSRSRELYSDAMNQYANNINLADNAYSNAYNNAMNAKDYNQLDKMGYDTSNLRKDQAQNELSNAITLQDWDKVRSLGYNPNNYINSLNSSSGSSSSSSSSKSSSSSSSEEESDYKYTKYKELPSIYTDKMQTMGSESLLSYLYDLNEKGIISDELAEELYSLYGKDSKTTAADINRYMRGVQNG